MLIVLVTAPTNQFEPYAPDAEAIAASIAIAAPEGPFAPVDRGRIVV